MERNTILEFLKKNTQEFNKFGVKKIGLFGSFASRRNTNNSDIDILVEFKTGEKTFDNYMDLKFFLEDRLKRKVDLVIEKNIKTELKEEILSTAKYA
ncbi:MAG: nucleotidyltransferase family protein [Thermotogota bacterium]